MIRPSPGRGAAEGAGPRVEPPYSWRSVLTTLRDEDITTTVTNALPGGDADQSDSPGADPAGVDPAGTDSAGGDADQSDRGDADQSDKGDADSSDS